MIIQVKVKPRSQVSDLSRNEDGTWVARIKSPPVDGKANEELLGLVAREFDCRKGDVSIKAGSSSRLKLVRVDKE